MQIVLAFVVIAVFYLFLLETFKTYNLNDFFCFFILFFILLISTWFLHELSHFFPLWLFSKQKPDYRITSVLLRENADVSKIEGLISYLLPFLVLSIGYIIISFFVAPVLQITLRIVALIHIPMCSWDFLFSFRLYKSQGTNVRLAHNKLGKLFETIFFHY